MREGCVGEGRPCGGEGKGGGGVRRLCRGKGRNMGGGCVRRGEEWL